LSKNTIFLSFDGLSDPLGQSQILPYLIGVASNGYHIHILTCEKPEALKNEKEKIELAIKDLPIEWKYIIYDERGGFISRFGYIQKLLKLAEALINAKEIKLIHCRSYLTSLIGLKLRSKYQIPFLFDMRGFWADERMDGGIWKRSNPIHLLFYYYFKIKERSFFKNADAIVSLTHAAATDINSRFGESVLKKITVIPCCTNIEVFDPSKINNAIAIPGIDPSDFLIIYTGSIGTWYYTYDLINCVLAWKKYIPQIKLLVLTKDQVQMAEILNEYTPEQRSIIITKSARFNEVPLYLAKANAAMFFIKPSYSKIASSPTKMAECWAMNLPIITNEGIGDNDIYFNEHNGGILLKEFNSAAFDLACKDFLKLKEKNINYRNIAIDHFNLKSAIVNYTNLYNKLAS
jgi:glycosyltransferase involved in cell wall biosynthesis